MRGLPHRFLLPPSGANVELALAVHVRAVLERGAGSEIAIPFGAAGGSGGARSSARRIVRRRGRAECSQ